MSNLLVAFKGNGNAANKIVRNLDGDKLFLTNSYSGLIKDIDNLDAHYELVYMFGLDKKLNEGIRIERVASKNDISLYSDLDLNAFAAKLNESKISVSIGNTPTKTLCNDAFWYMLKKYNRRVVFFHVPSIKYITQAFIESIKNILLVHV